jgi:hypothetical protein
LLVWSCCSEKKKLACTCTLWKKKTLAYECVVCVGVTSLPCAIHLLRPTVPSIPFCSYSLLRSILQLSLCASYLLCLLTYCCCCCRVLSCSCLCQSTLSRSRFLCKLFTALLAVNYTCLTWLVLSRWKSVSLLSHSPLGEFCRVGD